MGAAWHYQNSSGQRLCTPSGQSFSETLLSNIWSVHSAAHALAPMSTLKLNVSRQMHVSSSHDTHNLLMSVCVCLCLCAALPGQEKVWRLLDNAKVGHIMSKTGMPCSQPVLWNAFMQAHLLPLDFWFHGLGDHLQTNKQDTRTTECLKPA